MAVQTFPVKRCGLSRAAGLVYAAGMGSNSTSKDARAERLAAALRANLRKRKVVERAIGTDDPHNGEGAPPSAGSAPSD